MIGFKFEKQNDGYLIHQEKYLKDILKGFNIENYTPCSNMVPIITKELRKRRFDENLYRQAIRCLLYLVGCTRPDILFAVNKASRRTSNSNLEDWINVIKIFRYLKGNPKYGLKFKNSNPFDIYIDANYGGDTETSKSTTGYRIMMNGAPTSWYSIL